MPCLHFSYLEPYSGVRKGAFFQDMHGCGRLIGAILYGVSDEIHQMFVPTRTASPGDILMDTLGAGVGLLFGLVVYNFFFGKSWRSWLSK